ncbi:hypothetical protein GCM10009715_43640 [Paeniglutamicibacter psychrophenolicus]
MESIEVQWATAGQPLRVRRQGRVWNVAAEPVRWLERFARWETELRSPKGETFRIDSMVWHVQVSLGARSSVILTWELVHHAPTGGWRVRDPCWAVA